MTLLQYYIITLSQYYTIYTAVLHYCSTVTIKHYYRITLLQIILIKTLSPNDTIEMWTNV